MINDHEVGRDPLRHIHAHGIDDAFADRQRVSGGRVQRVGLRRRNCNLSHLLHRISNQCGGGRTKIVVEPCRPVRTRARLTAGRHRVERSVDNLRRVGQGCARQLIADNGLKHQHDLAVHGKVGQGRIVGFRDDE